MSQSVRVGALVCALVLSFGALACATEPTPAEEPGPKIEPRYQAREPIPEPWYNTDYIFGMTRSVTSSTIHPAAQVPILLFTIPLDVAFLPVALIGGFF